MAIAVLVLRFARRERLSGLESTTPQSGQIEAGRGSLYRAAVKAAYRGSVYDQAE
jgi:hypothetical protein